MRSDLFTNEDSSLCTWSLVTLGTVYTEVVCRCRNAVADLRDAWDEGTVEVLPWISKGDLKKNKHTHTQTENLPRESILCGVLSFFSLSSLSYSSLEDFSSSLSDGQLMWSWIMSWGYNMNGIQLGRTQVYSSGKTGTVWCNTWHSGVPSVENMPDDSSHTARLLTSFSLALD